MQTNTSGKPMLRLINEDTIWGAPSKVYSVQAKPVEESTRQWVFGASIDPVREIPMFLVCRYAHVQTEWQIIDQAVSSYSRVTVSLYDTLGPDVVGK